MKTYSYYVNVTVVETFYLIVLPSRERDKHFLRLNLAFIFLDWNLTLVLIYILLITENF